MPPRYAILREADCRLDLTRAAEILAPLHSLARAEMLQALHLRPGVLAWNLTEATCGEAVQALAAAGMPCRTIQEDELVAIPAAPRTSLRSADFHDDHLVFRSVEWEGQVPWEKIRLLDIVQEMKGETELVPNPYQTAPATTYAKPRMVRRARFDVRVFLEIICADPVLRMRVDRSQFGYNTTGLKMHSSRELNFRALCIALHMRSPAALAGPGFSWIAKGNNSHHPSGNTRAKFENFATWLLTVEQ